MLGLGCMTCCASKSYLLSAQPVSTSNAEAWKGVKLCLSLKYHLKNPNPFLAPCHWRRWWMLHFPCQFKQCQTKSPIIPLGPNHFQGLITSLNITAWSKWKPRHKGLIHAEPDPRSCCALMCVCASSAREALSMIQRGAWVPSKRFAS